MLVKGPASSSTHGGRVAITHGRHTAILSGMHVKYSVCFSSVSFEASQDNEERLDPFSPSMYVCIVFMGSFQYLPATFLARPLVLLVTE
jgi:hypothetical protein